MSKEMIGEPSLGRHYINIEEEKDGTTIVTVEKPENGETTRYVDALTSVIEDLYKEDGDAELVAEDKTSHDWAEEILENLKEDKEDKDVEKNGDLNIKRNYLKPLV